MEPIFTPSPVLTLAVEPSATYATLPPTVPLAFTLMSPAVDFTYLSAAALTDAFSVTPFAADKVTFLPSTAPLTKIPPPSTASMRTSPRSVTVPAWMLLILTVSEPEMSPRCARRTFPPFAVAVALTPPWKRFHW